jgi:hypothetical protein
MKLEMVDSLARRPGVPRTASQMTTDFLGEDTCEQSAYVLMVQIRRAFRDVDPMFNAIETRRGFGWLWHEAQHS